jgi:Bacterial extracellular solute-binding proteins, family 5 Middle
LLRRLVASSLAVATLLAAAGPAKPARRPRYGGKLRVEIGAVVGSLDPSAGAATAGEAAAKEDIDSLLYGRASSEGSYELGLGPFRVAEWEPGLRAVLTANENFRQGRPFVDSVEIQMGRTARDRLLDIELDRADIAEIPPEEVRRAAERGVRVSVSLPDELVAIVFVPGRPLAEDARVREALSRSIDRTAIVTFLLQKEGEPAGGLLPQWASGTAFLFSPTVNADAARNTWSEISGPRKIVLGYDSNDSLEQSIAERISVDARQVGGAVIVVATKPGTSLTAEDARFVRLRMASPNPGEALAHYLSALGPTVGLNTDPPQPATPQQIYDAERAIVSTYRIVPLVWLPRAYGLGPRVRDWKTPAPGAGWPFADVWLGDAQ